MRLIRTSISSLFRVLSRPTGKFTCGAAVHLCDSAQMDLDGTQSHETTRPQYRFVDSSTYLWSTTSTVSRESQPPDSREGVCQRAPDPRCGHGWNLKTDDGGRILEGWGWGSESTSGGEVVDYSVLLHRIGVSPDYESVPFLTSRCCSYLKLL